MKTYIRRQQHKNFKNQDIKQKEPPQNHFFSLVCGVGGIAENNEGYRDSH